MNEVIQTIRATGATKTLLAGGLKRRGNFEWFHPVRRFLAEGLLFQTHPHFHDPDGQKGDHVDERVQRLLSKSSGDRRRVEHPDYFSLVLRVRYAESCAAKFHFIDSHHMGLIAANYDCGLPKFGGVVSDYSGNPIRFSNAIQCGMPGFGPGTPIQSWYEQAPSQASGVAVHSP